MACSAQHAVQISNLLCWLRPNDGPFFTLLILQTTFTRPSNFSKPNVVRTTMTFDVNRHMMSIVFAWCGNTYDIYGRNFLRSVGGIYVDYYMIVLSGPIRGCRGCLFFIDDWRGSFAICNIEFRRHRLCGSFWDSLEGEGLRFSMSSAVIV